MKTIVAPTDFSPVSLNAVYYAAELACMNGATLVVINVCQVPLSFSEVPAAAYSITALIEDAEKEMSHLHDDLYAKTGGRLKILTEVREGDVIRMIADSCMIFNPYAVIMGTERANSTERFLFGGKTISALRHLPWPLIIVPPEAKFTSIRKIGLATDLQNVVETEPAMQIKELVNDFSAELIVLHVADEDTASLTPEKIEASELLHEMLMELKPKYQFINKNDIDKGITEFTERFAIDLLIIVPKKHSFIEKMFHKSHSRQLAMHTNVPVMALHT